MSNVIGGITVGHTLVATDDFNNVKIDIDTQNLSMEFFQNIIRNQEHGYNTNPFVSSSYSSFDAKNKVLGIDDEGRIALMDHFPLILKDEKELHDSNESVAQAWELLMSALHEYMVVRKLAL